MYIKNIVLDGFKSYAQRTEVNDFDPLFNAITGLNGSGKSNVLDSICFLLGITNLTHVRATNMQELIYKSGQAGITKATVTIAFDNTDKKQSPMGYETFDEITITRQIALGGRNKYLINGCNANNVRVSDLFRSVQLNVNNPHFLIMQGRITKVLNMKPREILSMIEEAAGTRLYENKKMNALKTMEKKESRINEINAVINGEITPKIKKLKEERSSYLEYQKVMRDIEHMTRLCVAYDFMKAEQTKEKSAADLEKLNDAVNTLKERSSEIDKNISLIEEEISEIQRKKDAESGNVLKELEKKVDDVSKIEAKASSDVKHAKDALNAEVKKVKQLQKNITDNMSQLTAKEKAIKKLESSVESFEKRSKADEEGVLEAQKHFQAVSVGLSSNDDGEEKTLTDQLMDCKNAVSASETEIKQAEIKLKYESGELKKKQAELKSTAKGYERDKMAFDSLEKERDKLQGALNTINYEQGMEEKLLATRKKLESELSKLQNASEAMEARFPNLQFEYSDPEPRFDRSKVKGLVCKLVRVRDLKYANALQVTAGAKLYNVIVDNEQTGKKLIQRGQLRRKVTIIPLNKIAARSLNSDVVNRAKSIVGGGNVHTALSLVGYDDEIEAAMKFVFGSAFVATSLDIAKKVAFDPKVKTRTVTLDGDVFDPSGTLSGGSRSNQQPLLMKIQEMQKMNADLNEKQKEFTKVDKEYNGIKTIAEKFNHLSTQLDMKLREIGIVEERLKQSTHHLKVEDLKGHENAIKEMQELIKKAGETKKSASKKAKDIEKKIEEKAAYRETELKNAEGLLNKAKKKAETSSAEFKTKQQELEELKLEVEALKTEITSLEEQIKALEDGMIPMKEEITRLTEIAAAKKAAVKETEEKLKQQKEILRQCSEQITSKSKEKNQLLKEASNGQLQLKEMEHKIVKTNKDSEDAAQRVVNMLAKYGWIESEKQYFGQSNTAYDFKSNDPKESAKRLARLKDSKEKLGANINAMAMNMLGKAEESYNDLKKKRTIVENDKLKIVDVIKELDEKKNIALRAAWLRVNKDFGSIFSTLLPGSNAKLSPPEGQGVLDGLEVRVAFGSVWKESLTELSGGQRSLVALSLILSMLLFKPAPIYILDEVDAALDLSHTQNIGQMLRQHFLHSQFIVVSLKDGMFTNANVLFKTKFVDGVSTISRFVQNPGRKDNAKPLPLNDPNERRKSSFIGDKSVRKKKGRK